MADQELLDILKQSVEVWNQWRLEYPDIWPDLTGAWLSAAKLSGANLSKVYLDAAILGLADLRRVNFRRASLREADLSQADLSEADLSEADLGIADLSGAKLSGAKLSGANLSGAKLSGANLSGANLSAAKLSAAKLDRANLEGANLTEAELKWANLSGAKLSGAMLEGANLLEANLSEAALNGVELGTANLREADLSGTSMLEYEWEQLHGRGVVGLDRVNIITEPSEEESQTARITQTLHGSPILTVAESTSTLRIRILEEPLTAQNLTTIVSTLSELYTKCWLIVQGRFPDLINYAQTHDIRFTKEANLTIGKISHNSPTLVELILNPTMLAAAAGAVVTLAGALKVAIDNIGQASLRFKEKELDIEIKRQEAQQTQQTAVQKASLEGQKAKLELERQQLELERQQLELERARLEVAKNRVEVALETASKMVDILRPGIDQETKGIVVQALLPSLLQLGTTEGLVVVSEGDEAPKEDNQA